MMMSCGETGELLEAWSAGTLPPREALGVSAHLADCPACRAQAELSLRILEALRELPLEHAPAGLASAVLSRLDARLDPERSPWRWVAAAGAFLAAGCWLLPPWEGMPSSLPDFTLPVGDLLEGALRFWESPVPLSVWVLAFALFPLALWSARKETVHA